ncbi:MAG: FAD-dependent oxidoreductase [Desulfatibacillaceae bacterium]
MKDPLFQPIVINGMEVKNRVYMPAMHLNMCENFIPKDQMVDFYAERAKGGAGMIVVGYATVNEFAGNSMALGAHDDSHIEGLSRLARAIRENGARASVQLNHSGRYNHSLFLGGQQPVAPSPVASRLTREEPREMTYDEIRATIDDFAKAAGRVRQAGYDAVEVLSATGYLISQFLSELTNKRTDEYGGSFENRMRFGLEIARAIRREVGPDFVFTYRINGNEFMPGGLNRRELQEYAVKLVEAGVDALCVNVGWHEARVPQIVTGVPRGVFGYLSRGIKERVEVPVIASHRINDPDTAREMIADGMCDMTAMGRSLIADPYLPEKARAHREDEVVHCVACAQGCFDNLFKLKPVECLCNPMAGHEKDRCLAPTDNPKKVLIAGGGAAGLAAAWAAAGTGHDVVLYERSDRLGGQLHLAGAPPGREEFVELAHDLERQAVVSGVRMVLNKAVDASVLDHEKPDTVIVATGAEPVMPPIPGSDMEHVVQAWDVLAGKVWCGQRVVVVGGGAVGVETALLLGEKGTLSGDALKFLLVNNAEPLEDLFDLATRGTKDVMVVEMMEKVGRDFGKTTRWCMMQDVERAGVVCKTQAKVLEITEDGLRVETPEGVKNLPADTVVMAAGSRPHNPLSDLLEQAGITHTVVGDSREIARAFEAIHAGFEAGRTA